MMRLHAEHNIGIASRPDRSTLPEVQLHHARLPFTERLLCAETNPHPDGESLRTARAPSQRP